MTPRIERVYVNACAREALGWAPGYDFRRVLDALPEASEGCEDCLRTGDVWIHLRICLSCGHVGCCDDSPNRHATAHREHSDHVLIRSLEPGEKWSFCFVDEIGMILPGRPGDAHPAVADARGRVTSG